MGVLYTVRSTILLNFLYSLYRLYIFGQFTRREATMYASKVQIFFFPFFSGKCRTMPKKNLYKILTFGCDCRSMATYWWANWVGFRTNWTQPRRRAGCRGSGPRWWGVGVKIHQRLQQPQRQPQQQLHWPHEDRARRGEGLRPWEVVTLTSCDCCWRKVPFWSGGICYKTDTLGVEVAVAVAAVGTGTFRICSTVEDSRAEKNGISFEQMMLQPGLLV